MHDLRFAFRQLLKNPGFTAVAVLTLALGIGANTAIFSVVNTVLLNPVPGPEPNRLMQIAECAYDTHNKPSFLGVSPPALEALRANQEFFSDFVWLDGVGLERKAEDFSDYVAGEMVAPNFFTLWNTRPILGRTFAKDEATPRDQNGNPTGDSVVVLSYASWHKLFAGDASVIGKTIELSGHRFTVIGVMPPHFRFPREVDPLVWMPAEPRRWIVGVQVGTPSRVLVRLKPAITDQQAQAMLDTLAQRLMKDHASDNLYGETWRRRPQGLDFWIRPLRYHFQGSYGSEDLRATLFGLLGAIGFVLLIVCVNVANLTLTRTERRQQELAIRAALGAARVQLMRQLLTESVLLACLGGLCGMVVTYWGIKLLAVLIPQGMPRLRPVQIDGHALGFTLLVSLITGLAFGLAPAWHSGRTQLSNALKQAGTGATAGVGRSKYRSALVITEVALSLVLLTGAGLMIQSVVRLLHVNPGYDPENLLFVQVYLPGRYADNIGDTNQTKQARGLLRNVFFSDAHHRLASLPGVKAAGILKDAAWEDEFSIDGRSTPLKLFSAGCGVEESDCFRAMRVPLLAGRYFEKNDIGEKAGTVILNESAARLCWPGEKAVGKKLRKPDRSGDKVYEVVGVVADARLYKYEQSVQPIYFRPYHEFDIAGAPPRFVVRTQQNPRDLIPAIHKELKAVEPAMITPDIKVVQQVLYDSTVAQRTYMTYLVVFAAVGLFLAALGIYGVLAYSIARRTREIGIRLAMGANRRDVLRMVIREGARLVIVGVAVGLVAAFCLTRLLRNQLFGISPTDPVVLAEVVLVVLAVALLACFLPARRATRIDPMEALRYE